MMAFTSLKLECLVRRMKNQRIKRKHNNRQKGFTVVLLALMSVVIFALLALVIGVSSLFSSHSRQQNNSNLAAYAAIEAFMRDESPNTLPDKLVRARAATNMILEKNRLFFFSGTYNPSTIWNGSYLTDTPELQFGVWIDAAPATCPKLAASRTDELTGCDCPSFSLEAMAGEPFSNAPCFIPYTETEMSVAKTPANAVRTLIRTPSSAITAPFISLIAKGVSDKAQINATAIAATVERCTVFLVDVSNSSFSMSHTRYVVNHEWYKDIKYNAAKGIFNLTPKTSNSGILGNYAILAPAVNPYSMYACTDAELTGLGLPTAGPLSSIWDKAEANLFWCNMEAIRPAVCSDPDNLTPPCDQHYRSDYDVEDTVDGMLAIDKFRKPQPLESIYVAVNSSLRGLSAKGTAMDKIAVVPFSDKIHGPVPSLGLSRNLDLMIDLTDIRRGGNKVFDTVTNKWITVGEEHPNFIDRGWSPVGIAKGALPVIPKRGTDLLGALHEGINRLSDPQFCGERARKTLVIATDGIMNMYYSSPSSPTWGNPKEIKKGSQLELAENLLYNDATLPDNILKSLIANDIHLLPMLVGDSVEPNFANVPKPILPPGTPTVKDCYANISSAASLLDTYFSIPELAARGYRGLPNPSAFPPEYKITNNTGVLPAWPAGPTAPSVCTAGPNYNLDLCTTTATRYLDGVIYRKPNGYLSQLAILSQGYYCPISKPYETVSSEVNAGCYETSCGMYAPYTSDPTLCDEQKSKIWMSTSPSTCARTGSFQTKSTYGDEMGGQASNCLRIALGAPPYYLATEEPF